jgi:hypothetical protein
MTKQDVVAALETEFAKKGLKVSIDCSASALSILAETKETATLAAGFAALHLANIPSVANFTVREIEGMFAARLPLTDRVSRIAA